MPAVDKQGDWVHSDVSSLPCLITRHRDVCGQRGLGPPAGMCACADVSLTYVSLTRTLIRLSWHCINDVLELPSVGMSTCTI